MKLRSQWRSYVHSLTLAGALVVTAAWPVGAQKSVPAMIGKDFEHAARDVWAVWSAPFDANAGDFLTGLFVLGAGVAISPLDDDIDRWAVRNKDASALSVLDPVRRGGFLYGGGRLAPVAGVAYVVGIATKNQDVRDAVMGCGASWAANNVLRQQILYRFIGRERPDSTRGRETNWPAAQPGDQYNFKLYGLSGSPWGMQSFPGGHIANVVGCASFFSNRFHWGFVEPVLYLFSAGVLVARTFDRGHWTSDELVGTVFGYAIGKEVAHQQLRRVAARTVTAAGSSGASVSPKDGFFVVRGADDMRVGWQVRF
jgi:membrane-associated phospholipid phosphatase